jgi:hypothetical protein
MLVVLILVVFSTLLTAQQSGSVVGTVADKTSAVVTHAKVTLINTATKDARTTTTGPEGFFTFSGVVVGDYSVEIESQGFQTAKQSGIHVSPGDRRNLNVILAIGTTNEQITVVASASAVTVDSADLSSLLNGKQIGDMALTGRDVTELIKTLPGFNTFTNFGGMKNQAGYDTTVTSIQSAVGNAISANGIPSRAGGADLVSDGAHILDPGCNCNATQTIDPDMVAEVKVTSSAYGADQVTGPVVVSAVSKSGTAEYHGGAYLHFRDASMNSNSWMFKFNKLAKPDERYWYPGAQISGPIPYTHKKLIAFAGYEYYNQLFPESTSGGLVKSNVPTLSQRAGHFDPTLPDNAAACSAMASWVSSGYRCQQFTTIATDANTTVDVVNQDISAYLAPGGLALLNEIPKPNVTPTSSSDYNYVKPLMNTNNGYMFQTRVDYNLSENTKLYVSYHQQHELYGQPVMRWWMAPTAVDYPAGMSSSAHSKTIAGNLVRVFSPTTTNEFIAGVSYLYTPNAISNEKLVDKTATNYPTAYPTTSPILPSIGGNPWWSTDFGIPYAWDAGRYAYFIHKVQPSFTDNFTRVFKTHTLKAGASYLGVWDKEASFGQGNGPNGSIGYVPVWGLPGNAWGLDPVLNLMTDLTNSFSTQAVTSPDLTGYSLGFYAQDEWKVSKRLTLNFGLRLAHDTPYSDATGTYGVSAWKQAWYDTDVANGVTDLPGMRWHGSVPNGLSAVHHDTSIPLAGHSLNAVFYGPRFGFAFDVFGNAKTVVRGGGGNYYYRDGLGGSAGTSNAMGGSSCSTTGHAFLTTISAATISCASSLTGLTSGGANDPNDHVEPYTWTYNFTVSQQIGKTQFEISYVGSRTSDLINPLTAQLNSQVALDAFTKPDPNPASPYYGQLVPVKTILNSTPNDYQPLLHYTTMNLINHGAWSNYNALQAAWSKREGHLTYNLNYTFSKMMGINTTADPFNMHNDYGILSGDRTHVFNASYAYEVGNRFKSKPGAVALNGWMISGITSLQSGPPIQESFSMTMGFGGTDTLSSNNSVNSISGSYFLGSSGYSLMPKLTCNPSKNLISGQYINASCFSIPSLPTFDANGVLTAVGGNGQIEMPYFRGPMYFSSDLALSRTIKVTERQNVQIKFSATNFLNHPLASFDQDNANNLNLNYSAGVLTTSGTGNGGGWHYGVPNEKFGGRRVMEMSLRYNF